MWAEGPGGTVLVQLVTKNSRRQPAFSELSAIFSISPEAGKPVSYNDISTSELIILVPWAVIREKWAMSDVMNLQY